MKSMKGMISRISLLKHDHFSLRKISWNENRFLPQIYNGKCWHLFPIWKSLGSNTSHNFWNFFSGYFHVCYNDFLIFVMCWNLISYRGHLKREILKFFILINISHFKYFLKIFASLMFTYNVLLLFNFKPMQRF